MKKIFILLSCSTFFVMTTVAQPDSSLLIEPYFTAIIVEDIDRSIDWHSKTLGFTIVDKKKFTALGFKQANLRMDNTLLELIQLDTAIKPAELIPDYSSKTKIQGIFKIGFRVSDFDKWFKHLEKVKTRFNGGVVVDNVSGKRMLILLDPDGNSIQLFEK